METRVILKCDKCTKQFSIMGTKFDSSHPITVTCEQCFIIGKIRDELEYMTNISNEFVRGKSHLTNGSIDNLQQRIEVIKAYLENLELANPSL